MHRFGLVAFVIASAASSAAADPTQLGVYLGPRVYSDDSALGYIDDAPAHPTLDNGLQLGVRVARPVLEWLVPEVELAFAPTKTKAVGGADSVDVFWMEPRIHARFEMLPGNRIEPFFLVGIGAPIALSSARMTFDSGITGEGYVGAGLRFDSYAGFTLRADARVSFLNGVERYVAAEVDISLGIEIQLGKRQTKTAPPLSPTLDRDSDGIVDAKDTCVDRAEDADGFDDLDGCPDIDNDLDRVLDIADKCSTVPESYNGYEDDDGCPDSLPPEVDGLRGTVEGLLYAEGETVVRDSAMTSLKKIAKIMKAHPSIRVQLIGHTDDREAKQFAEPVDGQPAPDIAQIAMDVSRGRAEAVRQALVSIGVEAPRIEVLGKGAEDSVADNAKPKGRLANRRVEIKLYVPPR